MDFEQKEAINHSIGSALVIAGPGCGKTTVITERIFNMVDNLQINPTSIVALSFTRYSSNELRQRTISKDYSLEGVFFGTIHSFFLSILIDYFSYPKNSVIGNEEKNSLLKSIISTMISSDYIPSEAVHIISSKISEIKNSKNNSVSEINVCKASYEVNVDFENYFIKEIYNKYNTWLEKNHKLDYDDILSKTFNQVKSEPYILNLIKQKYKYFIIDEFQDISKVQFDTIRLLLSEDENLFAVGDEDQSIYGFRGASPVFMVDFENYFKNAKIYRIIKSYRCPAEILNIANELISKNKSRTKKILQSSKNERGTVRVTRYLDVFAQAKNIASEIKEFKTTDNMIISRTNFEMLPLIKYLRDYNIKFKIKDKEFNFFSNFIFKDIMAYLKLSENYSTKLINKIRNKPDRSLNYIEDYEYLFENISVSKIKKLIKLHALKKQIYALNGLKFFEAVNYIRTTIGYDDYLVSYSKKYDIDIEYLYEFFEVFYSLVDNETNVKDAIKLLEKEYRNYLAQSTGSDEDSDVLLVTAHSSKGLEADNVYLVSLNKEQFPHIRASDIEEERRLAYVAITRAKKNLYISYLSVNKRKTAYPSEFLSDIERCIKSDIEKCIKKDIML